MGEIEKYRHILAANESALMLKMIQQRIDDFKMLWSSAATPGEKNKAYRLLINKIVYDREDSRIILEVLYK
jgi:site-specific DNA recombinase